MRELPLTIPPKLHSTSTPDCPLSSSLCDPEIPQAPTEVGRHHHGDAASAALQFFAAALCAAPDFYLVDSQSPRAGRSAQCAHPKTVQQQLYMHLHRRRAQWHQSICETTWVRV